ncbi:hypothetical protein [Marinoscillum sp.]|uniref:hypothetical protein n=1 Tax=Marinoscillum sp. TaxID=2024838 RepID=UPI003BAA382E
MKSILSLFIVVLVSMQVNAQYSKYFMPPVEDGLLMTAKEVYAVTIAGDTIRGSISSATMMDGQVRALTIKQADKTKVKLKSADVTLLAVKTTRFMNQVSALATPNIQRASEMDFDKIMEREWVIFDQALLPNKNKYALMQLLNPGFDSKIKVYINPNANETGTFQVQGLAVAGGEDTSYLVVTEGSNQAEIYKKRKYDDEALTRLYKDCPEFEQEYAGEKFRWSDFSEHVLVYDQLCQ